MLSMATMTARTSCVCGASVEATASSRRGYRLLEEVFVKFWDAHEDHRS